MPFALTILVSSLAHAVGGALVGPIGEDPPTSAGTQVMLVPDDTGTTLVLTIQVDRAAEDLAVLWPAAGLVPTSVVTTNTREFDRIEAFTRPRVEDLGCAELVAITHWRTPPGCSSYDYVEAGPTIGEDAITSVPAALDWSDATLQLQVIDPLELPDWLALRGFALDPAMAAALQPHLDAGEPLLTIQPDRAVAAGTWLPPVRFRVGPGDVVLPLTVGAAVPTPHHELHVYSLATADVPNPSMVNYPPGFVQDECLLDRGDDASPWLEAARDALVTDGALLPYVVEYAGRTDGCDPCVVEPLDKFELPTFGFTGDPADARISRIWMDYRPGELDEDPVVTFTGVPPSEVDLHFLAWDPDLQFAFPVCGSDAPLGGGTCPNVHVPGSGGCDTAGSSSLVGLVLAAVVLRRRRLGWTALRVAALGFAEALGLMFVLQAHAAPVDLGPKTEAHGALAVFGTDRVVPEGLEHGGPWLANPFVGAELRRSWVGLRSGVNVGVLTGIRGWAGRAAPWSARGVTTFWLVEPQLGLDVRHGRFREASPSARFRYGISFTLTALVPSVSPAQFVPSAALHAGYGWWIGRGLERTSVELRGSVVPRTDGFETRYHPNVGLPGFMFYPGTANLWIVVGRAWY